MPTETHLLSDVKSPVNAQDILNILVPKTPSSSSSHNTTPSSLVTTPDPAQQYPTSPYSYRHDPYNVRGSWVVFGEAPTTDRSQIESDGDIEVRNGAAPSSRVESSDDVSEVVSPQKPFMCHRAGEQRQHSLPCQQLDYDDVDYEYNPEEEDKHGAAAAGPPQGTLHGELWGRLGFTPYPVEPFGGAGAGAGNKKREEAEEAAGMAVVRLFIGQVPYFVSEMELAWIVHTFGGGRSVICPERILKRNAKTGQRQPTGCLHAFTTAAGLKEMVGRMHKQLLIDDTGVWHCRSAEEVARLADYCRMLKADPRRRPHNRPYDSIVVQEADSGCFPRHPTYLNPAEAHKAIERRTVAAGGRKVRKEAKQQQQRPFGGDSHVSTAVHRDLRTVPFYREKSSSSYSHAPASCSGGFKTHSGHHEQRRQTSHGNPYYDREQQQQQHIGCSPAGGFRSHHSHHDDFRCGGVSLSSSSSSTPSRYLAYRRHESVASECDASVASSLC